MIDVSNIVNEINQNLVNEFDKIVIKGLENKGYFFKDKLQLENFIKDNCNAVDDCLKQTKTYYVKSEPFLIHFYASNVNFNYLEQKITADYGYYRYL